MLTKEYESLIMASAHLVLCHVDDSHAHCPYYGTHESQIHELSYHPSSIFIKHSTDAALLPLGLVFVVPGFRLWKSQRIPPHRPHSLLSNSLAAHHARVDVLELSPVWGLTHAAFLDRLLIPSQVSHGSTLVITIRMLWFYGSVVL